MKIQSWHAVGMDMRLDRDSVAAGDDVEAHARELSVDPRRLFVSFLREIVSDGYLPLIEGGQHDLDRAHVADEEIHWRCWPNGGSVGIRRRSSSSQARRSRPSAQVCTSSTAPRRKPLTW